MRELPAKGEILPELYAWPRQYKAYSPKFQVDSPQGDRYEIVPRYVYDIYGLVVTLHHSDSWIDISHKGWGDSLNAVDLSLVYGNNLKGAYKKVEYSHGDWTGSVKIYSNSHFDIREFSNNHILADKPEVIKKIKAIEVGDQVFIKGFLCDYKLVSQGEKNKPFFEKIGLVKKVRCKNLRNLYRKTSTVRTDEGNGACEIIYVTDIKVLKRANEKWRALAHYSKWGAIVFLLISSIIYFATPVGV